MTPRFTTSAIICGIACVCVCSLAPAQVWSPDGLWVAYTTPRSGPADNERSLLEALVGASREEPVIDLWASNRVGGSRLWATRIDTGESVALDEQADGWLTEPAWASDGRVLAYGRVVGSGREGRRFELVLRDAIERARVLKSWDWAVAAKGDESRAAWAVTWSPDGGLLTVPVPGPDGMGLAVVHADNGEVTRRLPGAFLPRWAPNGRALAFLCKPADDPSRGAGTGVWIRETDEQILTPPPRSPVVDLAGAPAWRDEGRVLLFASALGSNAPARIEQLVVSALPIESRKPLPARDLAIPADLEASAVRTFQIAPDPQGDGLFTSHALLGQLSTLSWFRGGSGAVFKRYNPFDHLSPLIALSVSPRPGLRRLAFRVVGPAGVSPPALSDPETESFQPLAPDAAATACWQRILAQGILDLASEPTVRGANLETILSDRPTRIPVPGESSADHPNLVRMKRMGAQIASLQRRRDGSGSPVRPAGQSHPVWLLVAAIATGDTATALDELDRLELDVSDRPTRWRLLGLRAQLYLGQGQFARASAIVEHLRGLVNRSGQRIEEAAGRVELDEPSVPGGLAWVDSLHECLVNLASGRNSEESPTPMGFPPTGLTGEAPLVEPDLMPQAPPEPQPPPDAVFPARRRRSR